MSVFESRSPAVRRTKLSLAAIGLLAIGGVAGGAVGHAFQPPIEMAPSHVVAIRNLASSDGILTIKGRVAERFGSRLVLDDGTGRTLVDIGPRNQDTTLAPLGATVSVQGRFDRSAFHPSFLVDPAGTVTPLGPPHGPHGPHGHPGPGDDEDRGPDRAPPSAAPVPGPAPAHGA